MRSEFTTALVITRHHRGAIRPGTYQTAGQFTAAAIRNQKPPKSYLAAVFFYFSTTFFISIAIVPNFCSSSGE
jgi:hypothetical protein